MKKAVILFLVFLLVSVVAFANDEYVAVRMNRDGSFAFSNTSFSLATVTNREQGLASLCNYMHSNGYVFIQTEAYMNNELWIALFKKK